MDKDKDLKEKANPAAQSQLLKNELSWISRFREGDVVEASLLKKTRRYAFFDLGKFGTGIVYGAELGSARSALKGMNVGDKIPARVETLDGYMGYVELSLSEAGKQKLWQLAKELEESGELVKVKVSGANQGGLMADMGGFKAFLPVSQLAANHIPEGTESDKAKLVEELKKLVGEEFSVKVINVNQRTNKLIVSEREGSAPSSNVKELLSKYSVGQIVDGVVSGIADFGIFIKFADNPEIEGLVHISEIAHRLIESPKEIIKLGEAVKVKILDIKDGRVFLSLKALQPDPWASVSEKYHVGDVVVGTVYKFNPFGAIVEFDGGIQGMIHISEFGGLEEMKKELELKKSYRFEVSSLKPEERRMILKMKK